MGACAISACGGGAASADGANLGTAVVAPVVVTTVTVAAGTSSASIPSTAVATLPDAPTPTWGLKVVVGLGHLSLEWPQQQDASSYAVWVEGAGATILQPTLSRAGITLPSNTSTHPAAPRLVHTVMDLDASQTYKVHVKAHMPDGRLLDSEYVQARPNAFATAAVVSEPRYMPAQMALPVLSVVTQSNTAIVSRENYVTASFALYADDASYQLQRAQHSGALQIRGRGNSSWDFFDKKPYRLKLDTSAALVGMPKSKHWVLITNHGDKTLLRNTMALELARQFVPGYTPRAEFVELLLNGEYVGVYQLTEHVRVDASRVSVPELGSATSDDVLPALSGGYLAELDRLSAETSFSTTICGLPFTLHSPEKPSATQKAYIRSVFNNVEKALFSNTFTDPVLGYASQIDVDSFVNWYIHAEITFNIDSFRYSTYFYKNRNAKLAIGPVWDFDLAMGNNFNFFAVNPARVQGWGPARYRCWYDKLLADPAFEQLVKARWRTLRAGALADVGAVLAAKTQSLAVAQANNFARWPVLAHPLWQNAVVTGSYAGELEVLDFWLRRRIAWLDAQWL